MRVGTFDLDGAPQGICSRNSPTIVLLPGGKSDEAIEVRMLEPEEEADEDGYVR